MNWRFFPLLVACACANSLGNDVIHPQETQTNGHNNNVVVPDPNSGGLRTPAHAPMSSKSKSNLQDEEPSRKLRATSHVGYTASRALSLSSKADLPAPPAQRQLQSTLASVGNNGNCDDGGDDCFPLGNCQGDCDNDVECEVCLLIFVCFFMVQSPRIYSYINITYLLLQQ